MAMVVGSGVQWRAGSGRGVWGGEKERKRKRKKKKRKFSGCRRDVANLGPPAVPSWPWKTRVSACCTPPDTNKTMSLSAANSRFLHVFLHVSPVTMLTAYDTIEGCPTDTMGVCTSSRTG